MGEKKMPLEGLVGWLDDNDVPYGIDDAGKLTVKGDLREDFRRWVKTRKYTSLPDELVCVEGSLWLERTLTTSLGNLISVGRWLDLRGTPTTSLGNLASVGKDLDLRGTFITSLDDLPQVGGDLHLDQGQLQLLTEDVLQKVKGKIRYPDQVKGIWVTLPPAELEAIVVENEQREKLNNTRESDVDWDLYDR